jgi:hypothetical protein
MKDLLEEKVRDEVLDTLKKYYQDHENHSEIYLEAITSGYLHYLSSLIDEMNSRGHRVGDLVNTITEVASSIGKFIGTYNFETNRKIRRG